MLTHGARPRQLRWYHAGPMLFGDWGTSRLYVLGLALAYTHFAALWFMGAMSVLLLAVGWAYMIVCRLYPDGGGVYAAAKERSQTLAVVGALLLCADYVVTASLSALEAFHYAGFDNEALWAAGAIVVIGALNHFGPTKAGTFAIVVAVLTILLSVVVACAAIPSLDEARAVKPEGTPWQWWRQFTSLILAISGVEAIANMTGIMVPPVGRTSRRAILPVVLEIVVLNLILTAAMTALPTYVLGDGDPSRAFTAHRETMMRLLAEHYVGETFARAASVVFALLLLSAVNTAVTALVSIQYTLAQDRELPYSFGRLNFWGVPVVPLVVGTLFPAAIVLLVSDVGDLADLYAIGVVGAVAVNLGCVSTNFRLELRRYERIGMLVLAILMVAIWLTIAVVKSHALFFATGIMAAGFSARYVARRREDIAEWVATVAPAVSEAAIEFSARSIAYFTKPGVRHGAVDVTTQTRILVATRNNPRLIRFALEEAKLRNGEVYLLFVRHIAVTRMGAPSKPQVAADPEAAELFATVAKEAEEKGVPVHFLYTMAYDVAEVILEMAVTHAVDYLILGSSQRGALWRTMKGDVIRDVAQHLPERINMLLHG
jgi:amino acid transporter/nucleotide-binding universal stress UspA family protein